MLVGLAPRREGHHIRAARAFLDGSMTDRSRASGLPFSTVQRLEGGAEASGPSSRYRAVAALRASGILFSLIEGAAIVAGQA
ncbi:hypothetical protein ASF20_21960 [Methylobacterium sp. Leaf88]|nr:hypothetical protein ASF20_21960 [Methylobacterium sp. Leaf88]